MKPVEPHNLILLAGTTAMAPLAAAADAQERVLFV
jgi:hypothetical protein